MLAITDSSADLTFEDRSLRAIDSVDAREGYATYIAKFWRGAAGAVSILAIVAYSGWAWQAYKSTVEWLPIPIDKFGDLKDDDAVPFVPSADQLVERANDVVKAAFSISTDWRVNQDNYEFLTNMLRGSAVRSWRMWFDENNDPSVTERIVSIVNMKPTERKDTLNVIWEEQDIRNGQNARKRRINGNVTMQYVRPTTRAEALNNKLGIYVTGFTFGPEK